MAIKIENHLTKRSNNDRLRTEADYQHMLATRRQKCLEVADKRLIEIQSVCQEQSDQIDRLVAQRTKLKEDRDFFSFCFYSMLFITVIAVIAAGRFK